MKDYTEPHVDFIPLGTDIITASGDSGSDIETNPEKVPLSGEKAE